MNIKEIEGKTDDELRYDLDRAKKELFELRFSMVTGTAVNSARLRELRRTVARIKTIQHERTQGIHGREPR